jgi:hypothetical protein
MGVMPPKIKNRSQPYDETTHVKTKQFRTGAKALRMKPE